MWASVWKKKFISWLDVMKKKFHHIMLWKKNLWVSVWSEKKLQHVEWLEKKVSTCRVTWKKVATCCVRLCHVGENLVSCRQKVTQVSSKKSWQFFEVASNFDSKKNFSSISDRISYKILITFFRLKISVHQFSGKISVFLVQKMLKMFPYTFSFLSTYPNQKGPLQKKLPRRYCLVYPPSPNPGFGGFWRDFAVFLLSLNQFSLSFRVLTNPSKIPLANPLRSDQTSESYLHVFADMQSKLQHVATKVATCCEVVWTNFFMTSCCEKKFSSRRVVTKKNFWVSVLKKKFQKKIFITWCHEKKK